MNKPDIKSSKEDTVPAAPLRNWHLNDKHRADHGDVTYPKVAHEDKALAATSGHVDPRDAAVPLCSHRSQHCE